MTSKTLKKTFNKPTQKEVDWFVYDTGEGDKAAVTKFLNKYGASVVNEKNSMGRTALMKTAMYGHPDIAELLLEKGADVHATDDDSRTALTWAAGRGRKNMVEFLLQNGAVLDHKDNEGKTVLISAARHSDRDMVALLLDQGADLHEKDHTGTTALMMAATQWESDIPELLLEKGADIHEKNNFGDTALMFAAEERNKDTVKLLATRGAAVDEKSAQAVKSKRKAGENFSVPVTAVSVLVDAANKGDLAAVTALLDEHGSAIINQKNIHGWMPLIWAIRGGHKDIVELLIDRGADINARGGDRMTPLMQAAAELRADFVELLLKKGASTEGQDESNGMTALMWAVANEGNKEIVEMLLEHGADLDVEDHEGETALEQAEHGKKEIAELIEQWPEVLKQRKLAKQKEKKHTQWLADTDFSNGLKKAIPVTRPPQIPAKGR